MAFVRENNLIIDRERGLEAHFRLLRSGERKIQFREIGEGSIAKSPLILFAGRRRKCRDLAGVDLGLIKLPDSADWLCCFEVNLRSTNIEGYSEEASKQLIKEALIAKDAHLSVAPTTHYEFFFLPERSPAAYRNYSMKE